MADRFDIQTLADMTRFHAAERGDRVALAFEDRETSFAELDRAASRVAQALLGLGLRPGTRCATVTQDSDHVYELQFGIAKARGVIQGINWRLAPKEIAYIVNDGAAEVLFVSEELFGKVEEIRDQLTTVKHIITMSGDHAEWRPYVAWRDAAPADDPGLPADPEEVVVQMHTSGTTGQPKGVMLPNRSFFAVIRSMHAAGDDWIGFREDDVSLQCFPMFHIGGFWWAITGLNAGAKNVVQDAFIAHQALSLIERHRVTKVCLVPAMLGMMLSEPSCKGTDFATLTHMIYGGSPIPTPLLKESIQTFGCEFGQIYGLTETGNTAVFLRPNDHHDLESERLKAAGRPYPGVRAKVIDEQGGELGAREIGEICLHSPANMTGYWNRPDATSDTLRDGWLHTGDAGYLDEDGYVFVCDRVKDMIIYAGENIYPAEVESAIVGHPAVAECAVIGVPSERWGEEVKAMVVLKPGQTAKPHEILALARGEIASFKVPKSVDFIDELPRTPSGKVRKGELRKPFWEGQERQVN
ncbi:MAG: fatty acid--CoA ligase [Planctomycetota bacterium]